MEAAIDKLPREYRIVLVLRDVEGLSAEETARGAEAIRPCGQVASPSGPRVRPARSWHSISRTHQNLDARASGVYLSHTCQGPERAAPEAIDVGRMAFPKGSRGIKS